MEPFGLLNLLSTLFPQAEQKQSDSTSQSATPSPAPPTQNTEPKPEPSAQTQNPCAEFLEAHERRARQTRR